MEFVALGWLASFLTAVLGPGLADRLKKKPSQELAREYAFALYVALGDLESSSAGFVRELRAAATNPEQPVDDLIRLMKAVTSALEELEQALEQVDPQLEVHFPEVAQEIRDAYSSRSLVVSEAERSLRAAMKGNPADLQPLVGQAEEALLQVRQATETTRATLAEEFTFKESF